MKICSVCKTEKDESEFSPNRARRESGNGHWEGRRPECKPCFNRISSDLSRKRWVDKNKLHWKSHNPYQDPHNGRFEKICSYCSTLKHIREFSIHRQSTDGLNQYCKTCFNELNSENRKTWRKNNLDKARKSSRESMNRTGRNRSLYAKMTQFKKRNIKLGFGDLKFTYKELVDWNYNQKRECYYCSCPESLIKTGLWSHRKHAGSTRQLTFDRKNNNIGYELDNLCLACDPCNVAKSNIFNEQDFIEIAQKYIKPMWQRVAKEGGA